MALERALYAWMVELVDAQVGLMLAVLDRRGMLDDTLVIFSSDHGDMLGDHLLSGKCFPHDPPREYRCWCGTLRSFLPAGQCGHSLVPLWQGLAGGREYVCSEDGGQFPHPFLVIRTAAWKFLSTRATGTNASSICAETRRNARTVRQTRHAPQSRMR